MAALHWLIHTRSPHSSIKRLFLFFFPSSVLFFLFLSLTSAFLLLITEGWGIMKPRLTQAVLGPVLENRSSLSLSLSSQWAPSHHLCSTPYTSSTHRFCFGGRLYSSTGSGLLSSRDLKYIILFWAVFSVLRTTRCCEFRFPNPTSGLLKERQLTPNHIICVRVRVIPSDVH